MGRSRGGGYRALPEPLLNAEDEADPEDKLDTEEEDHRLSGCRRRKFRSSFFLRFTQTCIYTCINTHMYIHKNTDMHKKGVLLVPTS